MSVIRKAVIPAAGYGTRFLPVTKSMPKEMLPILDKPIIYYVVEEAIASGITDIILVTGRGKRSIEDYFDENFELNFHLRKQKKTKVWKEIKKISKMANFIYIRQKGPYGNGTPILCAKPLIDSEPFAVMFGDDIHFGEIPCLKQMIQVYEKYTDPIIHAMEVDKEGTKKYGILDAIKVEKNVLQVKSIVEKPGPEKAPSRFASVGRYILTPDIFQAFQKTKKGKGGELWLVDAIFQLSKKRPIYACLADAKYYDQGNVVSWLKTNIDFALKRGDTEEEIKKYIKSLKL